jgi:class 3 adenylate cyclase/predicted ATPase
VRPTSIADWLDRIGLQQYVPLFEQHELDFDVLAELTDEDLKELEIPLGDRKRLRAAISLLAAATPAVPRSSQAGASAERRQITLVFCDLAGSTELASRLDPEDLAAAMVSYHECCKNVIDRWDGHVAEFLGDGAVIYFGWPTAHEDDAERALRASLELVAAVGRLSVGAGGTLSCRAGVASGLVMVGETKSDALPHREGVVGETPNLAARAQALAAPGTVVITPGTRRLVGDRFELEELGVHELRGIAGPVEVWRVVDVRAKSRFEARAGHRFSPLVGRQDELDLLLEAWRAALSGGWRSVLIVGDAGIGKSRLLQELIGQTGSVNRELISLQCSPYHVASVLLPFVEWIRSSAGIELGSDERAVLAGLEALVERLGLERQATVPLLAPLLSVPLGERYEPLRLSLRLQRRRTIELVIELIERTAGERPLLIAVEDVHAADATSLEVMTRLVERTRDGAGLLVMTARPEFVARFRRRNFDRLDLEPLVASCTSALVDELTGGKPLPAAVHNTILDSADGVPLFVEELTRELLESPALRDAGDRYELEEDLAVTVPATLHDLLLARLDKLGQAKVTAHVASTLGRSFSLELLNAVAPSSERDLVEDVCRLCDGRILEVVDEASRMYAFRHALLREAAYQAQLKARRREVHLRVARVLEEMYPSMVESEPETLAHHLAEGGEPQAAADYLLKAGQKALHASAVREATTHLSRGLELIEGLAHTGARDRTELRLQALLGTAYMHAKSWGASEVEAAYSRAARLSDAAETAAEGGWILWGIWVYHHVRGRLDAAAAAAGRIEELAGSARDPDAALIADMVGVQTSFYAGRFSESVDRCESFLRGYDADRHRSLADAYSTDLELACLVHQAIATWILGQPDRAVELARRTESLLRELDHPYSMAWGSTWGAVPDLLLGNTERTAERVSRGRCIAEANDYAYVTAMAKMIEGWLDGRRGHADGADTMKAGLEEFRATGAEIVVPFFETLRAELLVEQLRLDEALEVLEEARAQVDRWGERWQEAEIWRVEANALAARGDAPAAVEARFRSALDIAVRQGALAWRLRASTDFARYLCDQQRPDEARGILEPVVGAWVGVGESADVSTAAHILSLAKDQLPVG